MNEQDVREAWDKYVKENKTGFLLGTGLEAEEETSKVMKLAEWYEKNVWQNIVFWRCMFYGYVALVAIVYFTGGGS